MLWLIEKNGLFWCPIFSTLWTDDKRWARRYWDRDAAVAKAAELGGFLTEIAE